MTDRATLGISLRLVSGVLFAGMLVCAKAVSAAVPLGEIVFFRSFFALIPLVIFLWLRKEFPGGLRTKRPGAHLLRSGFGALALFASFAALARLNVAEASLIAQLSPVLTALAAVALLGERLTIWRVAGLGLGFAGVVVLVLPEVGREAADDRITGYLLGLASAGLAALALIMVRSLTTTESPGAIAFYFILASMAGGLVTLPLGWVVPDGWTLALLIGAGLFGGFAHIAMTLAFRYAEASRLAPFEYVALLWPVLADLLLFRQPLSVTFFWAGALIVGAAVIAAKEPVLRRGPTPAQTHP
ncbi:permease [Jannaschia pagri]|uniref:Permease n=1 Tax=Jannaschia pagri TaxID=2829797 RepID=A0ABQ4NRQ6_9RHOB|nr:MULTISPECIES: DMT family transporter [unclassified Jannaschia]GIT93180.1 permease [Jannaschia sp. AI_61]GIT97053.1 permease [Jannaschia sp. AI_62]